MYMFILKSRFRRKTRVSGLDVSTRYEMTRTALFLALLLLLNTLSLMHFEQMSFRDAGWLTMTTVATVGYGDYAPKSDEGRLLTVLLMYFGGIILLARIGGLYFDYRVERRMKILKGQWGWDLSGHIVLVHSPGVMTEQFFETLIQEIRESGHELAHAPFVIVCSHFPDGLPESVRKLEVVHVHAERVNNDAMERSSMMKAAVVAILARDRGDWHSDSLTFDLVHQLRSKGFTGRIIAESVDPLNAPRLKEGGANQVIRPMRSYPELLSRAILDPGTEQLFLEMIGNGGATCHRIERTITAQWNKIATGLLQQTGAILLAYEDEKGELVTAPPPEEQIKAQALFVIYNESIHAFNGREIADSLDVLMA